MKKKSKAAKLHRAEEKYHHIAERAMHADEKIHKKLEKAHKKDAKPKKKRAESPKFKGKVEKVMHEYKEGKLHSGSKKGPKVSNPRQAVAIALSEARRSKK
jgi:hypothetical protein